MREDICKATAGPCTENVAGQLMKLLQKIDDTSGTTSRRVAERLAGVTSTAPPIDTSEKQLQEWPPFFQQIRDHLLSIQYSMIGINSTIDRLEL